MRYSFWIFFLCSFALSVLPSFADSPAPPSSSAPSSTETLINLVDSILSVVYTVYPPVWGAGLVARIVRGRV